MLLAEKVFLHKKANIVEKRSQLERFLHKNGLFVEKRTKRAELPLG